MFSIYTNYDKFLEYNMAAVILANYFHQHTLFAIKALKSFFILPKTRRYCLCKKNL